MLTQCWFNAGPAKTNDARQYTVNAKHLYNFCTMLDQRQRRWSDVVQMLYKCFVFAGYKPSLFQRLVVFTSYVILNLQCECYGDKILRV